MNSLLPVIVQFSMIIMIIAAGTFPDTVMTMVLFAAGIVLGISSVLYMGITNLRIFPEPKKDFRFVTGGPYRILRHPMYTSVLLFTASFIADSQSYFPYILWFILLAVLMWKIVIEERLLLKHLPEYAEYKRRTWRMIPFIF